MANNIRRQLTLFVENEDAVSIEEIRKRYNPKQFELIPCHVTLCREDEIENLEQVKLNLSVLNHAPIKINFGKPTRFEDEKGVLLPAISDNTLFQALRKKNLWGIIDMPRIQEPHITLMHPRNSTCTDNIFEEMEKMDLPTAIVFKTISLIEQKDGGKWNLLQNFLFSAY